MFAVLCCTVLYPCCLCITICQNKEQSAPSIGGENFVFSLTSAFLISLVRIYTNVGFSPFSSVFAPYIRVHVLKIRSSSYIVFSSIMLFFPVQDHVKGKRPAKSVALSTALLKKSGPPPALPVRSGGGAGIGPGSGIANGFGSNGSNGAGGFGSNGGGFNGYSPKSAGGHGPGSAFASPRPGGGATGSGTKGMSKGKAKEKEKAAADLAHCFELHSGNLLGDKRNREGRLYFKVILCVCVLLLLLLLLVVLFV